MAEYRALVEKVDEFREAFAARNQANMACGPGCASCCQTWLSVCAVERAALEAGLAALSAEERARIAERGRRELARERNGDGAARCAMLDDADRCSVYEHRPLLCRTQGLPLRYPPGVIPAHAVRARIPGGELTHCPLNYTQTAASAPVAERPLDAERVDQLLGLVNLRFARAHGADPENRSAISAIAACEASTESDREMPR